VDDHNQLLSFVSFVSFVVSFVSFAVAVAFSVGPFVRVITQLQRRWAIIGTLEVQFPRGWPIRGVM
jgi:hypothetical protein